LHSRRHRIEPDSKGEAVARTALAFEDDGKLKEAQETWAELAKQEGSTDKEKHAWGLVGEKYMEDLAKLFVFLADLEKKVAKDKSFEGDFTEEQLAVKALRAEADQKSSEARELWEELKTRTRSEIEQRRWF